jgi:hypothetical protein
VVDWALTVDSCDPARLVAFWSAALGYAVQPPPEGFVTWNEWYRSVGVPEAEIDPTSDGADRIYDPSGAGPRIWFQLVPEQKSGKNRLHLDLYPGGGGRTRPLAERSERVEARVAELVALGASVVRRYPADFPGAAEADPDGFFVVMADPEGNELCVG